MILFFTMVMLSFGIIIPILPFYIESFGSSGLEMGRFWLLDRRQLYWQAGLSGSDLSID